MRSAGKHHDKLTFVGIAIRRDSEPAVPNRNMQTPLGASRTSGKYTPQSVAMKTRRDRQGGPLVDPHAMNLHNVTMRKSFRALQVDALEAAGDASLPASIRCRKVSTRSNEGCDIAIRGRFAARGPRA